MPSAEHAAPDSLSPTLKAPAMTAEGETEMLIEPRPIRYSGFLALVLGLLGVLAVFGQSMLFIPAFAVLVALYALRPYADARPLGYVAAIAGLSCAILFAVWGITERSYRYRFMSERAVVFAGDWLQLMAKGDLELACELQRPPAGRQSESMPLAQYYSESEEGKLGMENFRENPTVTELAEAGDAVQWRLNRPPTYYTQNGRHLTYTIWQDDSGNVKSQVKIGLEYQPAENGETAQWTVFEIGTWTEN